MEPLNESEIRVLATLIEKQHSTPDYYPMTANAAKLGANQKNNRNPTTALSDAEVVEALDSLQRKKLTGLFHEHGARAPKYRQFLDRELKLDTAKTVMLAVFMLRGPQTLGEIKARSEYCYKFESLQATEETLKELMEFAPSPLATRLERGPGERENRYAHLLAGAPLLTARQEEKSELERRVDALEGELSELRELVLKLKSSLE